MKTTREHLSGWPSWLPKATPCVSAGKGQWKRARRLLARDDEASTTCAIVSSRGALIGVVKLDGREAWVRGEHVQPRRPGRRIMSARCQAGQTISLPPLSSVLDGWTCTITRVGDKPVTVQPHASDAGLPSPHGEVLDLNASSTNVRVGGGWRKHRVKLRSGLMRFEDWGSL